MKKGALDDSLQRRLRQQEALAEIGSAALGGSDTQAVLTLAVERVAHVLPSPLCGVWEFSGDGTLVLRAGIGFREGLVDRPRLRVHGGWKESAFLDAPVFREHGVAGGVSAVISVAGHSFGVLSAHTTGTPAFDEDGVRFLRRVADILAAYFRNRRAEDAITSDERRYRNLITAMSQLVWMTDAAGESLTLLGEPSLVAEHKATWAEHDARPVVHPDDREALRAAWAAARAVRERFDFGYRMLRADGEWRQVVTSGLPLLSADGNIEEWIGVVVDVTDRRRLQEQVQQSQKIEAVGQLAAGIAHDFNNLLTIIRGCSELLYEHVPDESLARELLRDLRDAGDRATALTRQLLTFSRKEVTTPVVIDVREVIGGADQMLRRLIGEDVELVVECAATPVQVRIDPRQLEQAIVNLAVNARDAMPHGGVLTFGARVEVLPQPPPPCPPGPCAVLTVSDTGSGMTPEIQARIFEPFFTTKLAGRGTGLGLATTHDIVAQSGGAIVVSSTPGLGTTFRICLPIAVDAVSGEVATHEAVSGLGTETILVIEDDPAVRSLTCAVLSRAGYTVLAAGRGSEAIRIAREHPSRIHLLISDVVMPGIGGRMAADEIIALRPGIRALFVSGYTDDALLRHGIERRRVAFLQKPFLPAELVGKVRDVLDGRT